MQRCAVAMLVVCAGCKFSVDAVKGLGSPADSDLAVAEMSGADLATATAADLGLADLSASTPPDLVPDPCAAPPALGAGNVAAQCVIGNPPAIDGNLADWPTSLFSPLTHSTSGVTSTTGTWTGVAVTDDADLSARWAARWDLTYLYIALSIVDDIRQTPNNVLTQNDCAELFFDGLHDRTQAYGSDDWQLAFSADFRTGVYQDGMSASLPTGVTIQKAFGGTSPNWTLEVAVPWTVLGGGSVTVGRVVGFDLKLDDNDSGLSTRDRDLVLYYNAPNGGGSCQAPYCRTDAFGAVQLQGR